MVNRVFQKIPTPNCRVKKELACLRNMKMLYFRKTVGNANHTKQKLHFGYLSRKRNDAAPRRKDSSLSLFTKELESR